MDFDGEFAMKILREDPNSIFDQSFVEKIAPRVVEGINRLQKFVQVHSGTTT